MSRHERSDSELVLAARTGDKAAFGVLVERHLPLARRVAMRLVAHQEIAWELAQEAVLEAYLALDMLREPGRFQSWLYGIVRNVCRSYLRSQRTSFFSLEALSGGELYSGGSYAGVEYDGVEYAHYLRCGPELDPQVLVERHELSAQVKAAIESLSPKNQTASRLFYEEQLSLQEIATQLGTSVNVIKSRLFQARKQLQVRLTSTYEPTYRPFTVPMVDKEKRTSMIKISAVHALEGVLADNYILYLLDTAGGRVLPIWVGPYEGMQISYLLQGRATPRPLTYKFIANLLDTLGATLQEVRVEALKETTFYAVVKAQNGKTVHELDARPSDALALALEMKSPIFVADEVMTKAGRTLPQPFDEQTWLQQETAHRTGMMRLAQDWEQKLKDESGPATPTVVQILKQAVVLAHSFNYNYIGTEHLLWALVSNQHHAAAKALNSLGVGRPQLVDSFARLVGEGQVPPLTEPVIVPRVAQVLELAEEERRALGHPEINAEHLLLGIVREGEGMAIAILRDLGVAPEQVRVRTLETIASAP